jgi:hypothetical protein
MKFSLIHCSQVKAPTEAVVKASKMAIRVLMEVQDIEDAAEDHFKVADDRVELAE